MGDRANIVLRQDNQAIYLYSHWGGYEMPETLRQGLMNGRSRWDDDTYLGRILFNTMTKGDEDGSTGYGIGIHPSDNEHPYLVVDSDSQTVAVYDDTPYSGDGTWRTPRRTFSFTEYVGSGPRTWENVLAPAPQEVGT